MAANLLVASLLSQRSFEEAMAVVVEALASVKDRLPQNSPGVVTTMRNVISGKVSLKNGAEVLQLGKELVERSEELWPRGHLNRAAAKGTVEEAAHEQAGDRAEEILLLTAGLDELMDRPLPNDYLFERVAGNLVMTA